MKIEVNWDSDTLHCGWCTERIAYNTYYVEYNDELYHADACYLQAKKENDSMQTSTKIGIYRHRNGGLYRVLGEVHDSTNSREVKGVQPKQVLYMSMTNGKLCVRDVAEFHEQVRRTEPQPHKPCLCDARGQGECLQHPGDKEMIPRFTFEKEAP